MSDGAGDPQSATESEWTRWIDARRIVIGRWWVERDAAMRALAPAWPVALIVLIAVFALCITDQGREAAHVSLDISGAGGNNPLAAFLDALWRMVTLQPSVDPTFPRYIWFLIAMVVFSLTIMASTVFVLAVDRQRSSHMYDDDRDPLTPDRVLSPIAQDMIHPSDLLRTRAALFLGLATPVLVALVALEWQGDGVTAGAFDGWLRVGVGVVVGLGLLGVLHLVSVAVPRRQVAMRTRWLEKVQGLRRAQRKPGPGLLAQYYALEVLRIISSWPTRGAIAMLAGVVAFLVIIRPPGDQTWIAFARAFGLLGLIAAIAVVAGMFYWARRRALRVVPRDQMGRIIVFDRIFARCYRGGTALLFLLAIVVFWSPLRLEIGPVAIFLQGLAALMGLLVWLVGRAMAPPRLPATLRVRVPWYWRPLYTIGAGMEILQRSVSPRMIFSLGFALLVFDRFILRGLEDANNLSDSVIGVVLVSVLIAAPVLIWAAPLAIRTIFRIPKGAIHLASIIIIFPFLLLTSGENHQLATLPVKADEPLQPVSKHAEAWLTAARAKADAAGREEIPVIVILAEGGGIRAASHVGHLLGRMEEQQAAECASTQQTDCPSFYDDVYAMSGVSGGAVGLATYLVAKAESLRPLGPGAPSACKDQATANAVSNLRCRIDLTLTRDHLSALFAGMFGSDIPSLFAPAELPKRIRRLFESAHEPMQEYHPNEEARGWHDRADFFEDSLQNAWARSRPKDGAIDAFTFDESLEHVALATSPNKALTPIVLFGTFSADDGRMAAAANVRFDECIDTGGVPTNPTGLKSVQSCFIDVKKLNPNRTPGQAPDTTKDDRPALARTLPLSTAAHLSARFPVSNPPGVVDAPVFATLDAGGRRRIEGWRHLRFVDGGYFDNSGAAAASFAVQALYDAADKLDAEKLQTLAAPEITDAPPAPGFDLPPPPRRLRDRLRVIVVHAYTRDVVAGEPKAAPQASFTEINTPAAALLNARKTSGYFPASSFCRLVAGDQAAAAGICDNLVKYRTAYDNRDDDYLSHGPSDADVRPRDPAVVTAILDQQATAARYNVAWINAPLDVAAAPDAKPNGAAPYEFVLLGWMLQQSSHEYIDRAMCDLAPHLLSAIHKATHDAGPARNAVPAPQPARCAKPPPAPTPGSTPGPTPG